MHHLTNACLAWNKEKRKLYCIVRLLTVLRLYKITANTKLVTHLRLICKVVRQIMIQISYSISQLSYKDNLHIMSMAWNKEKMKLYCSVCLLTVLRLYKITVEYKNDNTFEINLQSRETKHDQNILQYIITCSIDLLQVCDIWLFH